MADRPVEQEVQETALAVEAVEVSTPVQYVDACEMLKLVAEKKRRIAEVFDPIIAAAHKAHKEALAQRKKVEEPLLNAEEVLKYKIAKYTAEEEQRFREAQSRELSGDEGPDAPVNNGAISTRNTVGVPTVAGVSSRKLWAFRITDQNKIPRPYLKPDEVKIGQVVRALKDQTNIPGVEVFATDSVAVRSK